MPVMLPLSRGHAITSLEGSMNIFFKIILLRPTDVMWFAVRRWDGKEWNTTNT